MCFQVGLKFKTGRRIFHTKTASRSWWWPKVRCFRGKDSALKPILPRLSPLSESGHRKIFLRVLLKTKYSDLDHFLLDQGLKCCHCPKQWQNSEKSISKWCLQFWKEKNKREGKQKDYLWCSRIKQLQTGNETPFKRKLESPKSKASCLIRLFCKTQATNDMVRQLLGFIFLFICLFVSEQPKKTSPGTCLIPLCSLGWNIDPGEEMGVLCLCVGEEMWVLCIWALCMWVCAGL